MRRFFYICIVSCIALVWSPLVTRAATPAKPTVKDVALAFGNALVHNDGGMALSLLSPELRSHTAATQLPAMLAVTAPPQSVHVVRWAYNGLTGDATLSLRYAAGKQVAERLYMHLYGEGWRITSIVPEDALTLQRAAETAVVAFCDAALHQNVTAMRQELTDKLAAHRSDKDIMKLLAVPGPLAGYSVESFGGTPAGAEVVVRLQSSSGTVRDQFEVINDRDGWRISAVQNLP
jgi:hypothetical protein